MDNRELVYEPFAFLFLFGGEQSKNLPLSDSRVRETLLFCKWTVSDEVKLIGLENS